MAAMGSAAIAAAAMAPTITAAAAADSPPPDSAEPLGPSRKQLVSELSGSRVESRASELQASAPEVAQEPAQQAAGATTCSRGGSSRHLHGQLLSSGKVPPIYERLLEPGARLGHKSGSVGGLADSVDNLAALIPR